LVFCGTFDVGIIIALEKKNREIEKDLKIIIYWIGVGFYYGR